MSDGSAVQLLDIRHVPSKLRNPILANGFLEYYERTYIEQHMIPKTENENTSVLAKAFYGKNDI